MMNTDEEEEEKKDDAGPEEKGGVFKADLEFALKKQELYEQRELEKV